uniref:Putative secreted protein n=1 Tax=Amblyomma americanum TaxID=6943 RepID=A0A0C9RWL1_AMBAM
MQFHSVGLQCWSLLFFLPNFQFHSHASQQPSHFLELLGLSFRTATAAVTKWSGLRHLMGFFSQLHPVCDHDGNDQSICFRYITQLSRVFRLHIDTDVCFISLGSLASGGARDQLLPLLPCP